MHHFIEKAYLTFIFLRINCYIANRSILSHPDRPDSNNLLLEVHLPRENRESVNKAILVLNAGSSSIKFGIYTAADNSTTLHHRYRGQIEGIAEQTRFVVHQVQADGIERMVTDDDTLLPNFSYCYLKGVV